MEIKRLYSEQIKIGELSLQNMSEFIGIEITRDRDAGTLTISQTGYIDKVYGAYRPLIDARGTSHACIPYGARSTREAFDKMTPAEDKDKMDASEYLRVCEALVWPASMTRPDIQYAVSILCSFAQSAGQAHFNAAIGVLAYLYKTRSMGITYGGRVDTPLGLGESPRYYHESSGLHAYHDSSWGKEPYAWGGHAVSRDVHGRRTHMEGFQAQDRRG
jgi:hypothetical protein